MAIFLHTEQLFNVINTPKLPKISSKVLRSESNFDFAGFSTPREYQDIHMFEIFDIYIHFETWTLHIAHQFICNEEILN